MVSESESKGSKILSVCRQERSCASLASSSRRDTTTLQAKHHCSCSPKPAFLLTLVSGYSCVHRLFSQRLLWLETLRLASRLPPTSHLLFSLIQHNPFTCLQRHHQQAAWPASCRPTFLVEALSKRLLLVMTHPTTRPFVLSPPCGERPVSFSFSPRPFDEFFRLLWNPF